VQNVPDLPADVAAPAIEQWDHHSFYLPYLQGETVPADRLAAPPAGSERNRFVPDPRATKPRRVVQYAIETGVPSAHDGPEAAWLALLTDASKGYERGRRLAAVRAARRWHVWPSDTARLVLTDGAFSDADVDLLAALLEQPESWLEFLDVRTNTGLTAAGGAALYAACVQGGGGERRVRLVSDMPIRSLRRSPHIDLSDRNLGHAETGFLVALLLDGDGDAPAPRSLLLNCNPVGKRGSNDSAVGALCSLLARTRSLEHLSLNGAGLAESDVNRLAAEGLARNRSLRRLSLDSSSPRVSGTAALGRAIASHPCFQELSLRDAQITDAPGDDLDRTAANALAEAAIASRTLMHLTLAHLRLPVAGLLADGRHLTAEEQVCAGGTAGGRVASGPAAVDLCATGQHFAPVTVADAYFVAALVPRNTCLRTLRLGGPTLDVRAIRGTWPAAGQEDCTLLNLNREALFPYIVHVVDCIVIAALLEANTAVAEVNMVGNALTDQSRTLAGVRALTQVVTRALPQLECLDLSESGVVECPGGREAMLEFVEAAEYWWEWQHASSNVSSLRLCSVGAMPVVHQVPIYEKRMPKPTLSDEERLKVIRLEAERQAALAARSPYEGLSRRAQRRLKWSKAPRSAKRDSALTQKYVDMFEYHDDTPEPPPRKPGGGSRAARMLQLRNSSRGMHSDAAVRAAADRAKRFEEGL